MSSISKEMLTALVGAKMAEKHLEGCNLSLVEFKINNYNRVCCFLGQTLHESCGLVYFKELASGVDYDTGAKAAMLGNTPEADGDGQKYKGRGPIQITGKTNYKKCSIALYGDPEKLLKNPEILEESKEGFRGSAWFWASRGLNELADALDYRRITKIINGGYTHYDRRVEWLNKAQKIIPKDFGK